MSEGLPSKDLTSEITAFAAARLAPYKRPRLVHLVESLPRNVLGKIVRHQLDAEHVSGRGEA